MTHNTTAPAARYIALAAATTLTIISATCCAIYGWSLGLHHSLALAGLLAGAAFAAEALKPLAVIATVDALRDWRLLTASLFALLAAVLISYSVAAELSLAATIRGDHAAERAAKSDRLSRARQQYDRAETELNKLAPARSHAELKPTIEALRATPGARCDVPKTSPDFGPISRRVCSRVHQLDAEAARHSHRMTLQRRMESAEAILSGGKGRVQADPLAASLVAYGAAMGWSVQPEQLAPWLALLPVLLLELGSALGLLLARSLNTSTAERSSVQSVFSPEGKGTGGDEDEPPAGSTKGKVLELLEENGGRVRSGQRGLAALIGVSASRINQVLQELAAEGIVRVNASQRRGTLVELAAA